MVPNANCKNRQVERVCSIVSSVPWRGQCGAFGIQLRSLLPTGSFFHIAYDKVLKVEWQFRAAKFGPDFMRLSVFKLDRVGKS